MAALFIRRSVATVGAVTLALIGKTMRPEAVRRKGAAEGAAAEEALAKKASTSSEWGKL